MRADKVLVVLYDTLGIDKMRRICTHLKFAKLLAPQYLCGSRRYRMAQKQARMNGPHESACAWTDVPRMCHSFPASLLRTSWV